MDFTDAVADFPDDAINARPPNVDYTPWHLVEQVRITQWDVGGGPPNLWISRRESCASVDNYLVSKDLHW